MGILRSTLKFTLKGYLTWCAIDYTVQQGFWSDSATCVKAFNNMVLFIKNNIPETVIKQIPEIPKIPTKNEVKNTWNTQVINSSEFLLGAPNQLSNLIESNIFQNDQIESKIK